MRLLITFLAGCLAIVALHAKAGYNDEVPLFRKGEMLADRLTIENIPDTLTFFLCKDTGKELLCRVQDLTKFPPTYNMVIPYDNTNGKDASWAK